MQTAPFLDDMVSEGVVNLSALARKLKPQIETALWKEDISLPAIIMALQRRTEAQAQTPGRHIDLSGLGDMTVRSNLVLYTYDNTPTLIELQKHLLDFFKKMKDGFVNFSQGVFETTIIVSADADPICRTLLKKQQPVYHARDLSSITIRIPHESTFIPGYIYNVLRPLALSGINIIDITSVNKEITFIFAEADVDRAFSALKALQHQARQDVKNTKDN